MLILSFSGQRSPGREGRSDLTKCHTSHSSVVLLVSLFPQPSSGQKSFSSIFFLARLRLLEKFGGVAFSVALPMSSEAPSALLILCI